MYELWLHEKQKLTKLPGEGNKPTSVKVNFRTLLSVSDKVTRWKFAKAVGDLNNTVKLHDIIHI